MGELKVKMEMDMDLKNLSPRTKESYLAHMKSFSRHFNKSPDLIGDDEVYEYLYYLTKTRKLSQSTINQAYSALKFFYETTLQRDWHGGKIPRGKKHKKLPVVLSKEEVDTILCATRNLKYKTILMTIYSGGLRIREATLLKVSDIDKSRMMIRVQGGKGNKDRYTLLGHRTLEILRDYWKVYKPSEWLFPGKDEKKPLNVSSIQRTFKSSLLRANIQKHASVHTLRHSFATHLLESGVDLYYIQRFLGHTSASTTAIYLHVAGRDLAKIKSPIDLLKEPDEPIL